MNKINMFFLTLVVCVLSFNSTVSAQSFKGNVPSLQNYQTPDWFRDAKFGIYLHWGAYSVAERGEWYARKLYIEGEADYEHHVKNIWTSFCIWLRRFYTAMESREI